MVLCYRPKMHMTFNLLHFLLWLSVASHAKDVTLPEWPEGKVTRHIGHYPPYTCDVTNVQFNATDRMFHFKSDNNVTEQGCNLFVDTMWPVVNNKNLANVQCDQWYDLGMTFPMVYFYGSNYFHMHFDLMLPIYRDLYQNNLVSKNSTVVLLPMVESKRLEVLDWKTVAFDDPNSYWMHMLKVLAGDFTLQPVNEEFVNEKKNVCFRKLRFGARSWTGEQHKIIPNFRAHIWHYIGISDIKLPRATLVGVISRKVRRKILNEDELVVGLNEVAPTVLVEFDGMSFEEQVKYCEMPQFINIGIPARTRLPTNSGLMLAHRLRRWTNINPVLVDCITLGYFVRDLQRYTVLVGVNGAGLSNCLYLPSHSTCIQLVPFEAHLNVEEFGKLLSCRGPYLEWHNTHETLTIRHKNDIYNNNPDTTVHVEELQQVVKEALALSEKSFLSHKEEL